MFTSIFLTSCHKNTWQDKTVNNIDLIRAHILTESPGAIDPNNPDFMKNMSVHYEHALKMADQVNDYAGYYRVLNYFIHSFQDSNITLTHFAAPAPTQITDLKQQSFTLVQLTPNTIWLSWPTFSLDDAQTILWVKKMLSLAPSFRDEKNIVIDLRGNAQGDFNWGSVFLKKLYGAVYYQWVMDASQQMVYQYRVSDYAINSVKESVQQLKKTVGERSVEYQQASVTLNALNAVFERGDEWYPATLPVFKSNKAIATVHPIPLYHGRLLLITDSRCNNACLTFISIAKQFSHMALLGQTTDANTFYTQSSEPVYLDNGVQLHFGDAIEQNRRRGSNQSYQPDEDYSGDMSDTTSLQAWVLREIH